LEPHAPRRARDLRPTPRNRPSAMTHGCRSPRPRPLRHPSSSPFHRARLPHFPRTGRDPQVQDASPGELRPRDRRGAWPKTAAAPRCAPSASSPLRAEPARACNTDLHLRGRTFFAVDRQGCRDRALGSDIPVNAHPIQGRQR
jgi:hypothetical protein